jgi:hypothetical protein
MDVSFRGLWMLVHGFYRICTRRHTCGIRRGGGAGESTGPDDELEAVTGGRVVLVPFDGSIPLLGSGAGPSGTRA